MIMVRTIPRRWRPVAYSAAGVSLGVLVAGALLMGPLGVGRRGAGEGEDVSRLRAAAPVMPTAVFRSGQNAVRIVERPKPPAEPASSEPAGLEAASEEAAPIIPRIEHDDSDTLPPSVNGEVEQPAAKDDIGSETGRDGGGGLTGRQGDGATGRPTTNDQRPTTNEQRQEPGARSQEPLSSQEPAAGGEPVTKGRLIRVQVGRFAEERDALLLSDELRRQGFTPAVVRTEREGQVLYRVQVGTFRNPENADRTMEQLRQSQLEPYFGEDEGRAVGDENRKP
jgi:hypothetical protein